MLDWGALVSDENGGGTPGTGEILGHCPKRAPSISDELGHAEPSNGAASRDIAPISPKSPSEKQGGDNEATKTGAAGAAGPSNLCAEFPVSPVAVCLLVAYWAKVGGDAEELASALAGLCSMPPGEQERSWASACTAVGVDPWRVLHRHSNGEGRECFNCTHLVNRTDSLPHTRRRYFWHCDLHYQLLEHFQGGACVVIAPPECQSWEHWRASG